MSPITKQTIAIIGSSSPIGTFIAKGLCRSNYRLLLFEENCDDARLLSDEITESFNGTDVEFLDCSHQASWEADVIIIASQDSVLKEISEKIKDVVTQKTIAVTLDSESKTALKVAESYFPYSKVVGMISSKNEPDNIILLSEHTSALNIIQEMLFQTDIKTTIKVQTNYSGVHIQTPGV